VRLDIQVRPRKHSRVRLSLISACLACGALAGAQTPPALDPADRGFWIESAVLVTAGAAFDARIRNAVAANHTATLDRVASAVDPLGLARYLVPALAASYLVPRVAGQRAWSDAALRVGLGYAVSDGIEAALKPLVGRHRPDAAGGAWRFRPLSGADEWHSFPSAHTVHAFSIAGAVSDEAQRPWVSAVSYSAATLVGMQRVYRQAHWTSDVVASATLAIATSTTTVRWLRRHGFHLTPTS
jgi:membrane-associated phospholipid phosphatase